MLRQRPALNSYSGIPTERGSLVRKGPTAVSLDGLRPGLITCRELHDIRGGRTQACSCDRNRFIIPVLILVCAN